MEEALKKGMKNENALLEANKKAEETIQILKTKLIATSDRLDSSIQNVSDYSEKIDKINKQLINNTVDPKEVELLKSNLEIYTKMYDDAIKKQEIAIKEFKSLSNTNDPDIVNSYILLPDDKKQGLELFNNLVDSYREFLSGLSSDQLVNVFNIIGYVTLLMILTDITILLIGEQLIKNLKLETKYPKLAKYIKLKQTLNKHYLRFYIVLFYILILFLISVNIYMFFFQYL